MADLAWRKFPVNTIRNEHLDYISFMLPQDLKCAPYMFYMTAVCTCDDDGVFDIDDGVIFSRLMRIGSPVDVFNIARYMVQYRVITQVVPGMNVFMITDWEAPERRGVPKSKTAEERRAYIAQRIEAERRAKAPEYTAPLASFNSYPFPPDSQPQRTDFLDKTCEFLKEQRGFIPADHPIPSMPESNHQDGAVAGAVASAFFCDLNDKNAKSVDETERERGDRREIQTESTETKEIRKETHTENTERLEEREATEPTTPLESVSGSVAEETRQEETETEPKETELTSSLAEEALNTGSNSTVEASEKINEETKSNFNASEENELVEVINEFFVRNCITFDKSLDLVHVQEIIRRVKLLETEKNPAKIIIQTVLQQFRIRSQTKTDYFYKCNVTPQFLLTPNTWSHMLSDASALLLRNGESKSAWSEQINTKRDMAQVQAISNDVEAQCIKYGIDPEDPQRMAKLLAKTAKPADSGKPKDTG